MAAGGLLGGLLRQAVTEGGALLTSGGTVMSGWWPTMLVNVLGTAALALVAVRVDPRRGRLRAFLGPGLLGGFTTVSGYAVLARDQLAAGAWAETLAVLGVTLGASVLAVHLVRRGAGAAS